MRSIVVIPLFGHLELPFSGRFLLNALFILATNWWGPSAICMAQLLLISQLNEGPNPVLRLLRFFAAQYRDFTDTRRRLPTLALVQR